jgi:hypothetical protein
MSDFKFDAILFLIMIVVMPASVSGQSSEPLGSDAECQKIVQWIDKDSPHESARGMVPEDGFLVLKSLGMGMYDVGPFVIDNNRSFNNRAFSLPGDGPFKINDHVRVGFVACWTGEKMDEIDPNMEPFLVIEKIESN